MSIGKRIKELRLSKEMKQSDLAEKSGVSRVAIGNYERGDRIPKADILTSIAKALDVGVDELIGATDLTNEDSEILDFLYGEGLVGLRDIFKEFGYGLKDYYDGNIIIFKDEYTIAIPEKDFIELGNEMLKHIKEFKEFEIHKLLTKVNNREGK